MPFRIKRLFFELVFKATIVKLKIKFFSRKKVLEKIKNNSLEVQESNISNDPFVSDLIWANRIMGSNFKFFECFTKAISCKILLKKRDIPSAIHIGFKKDDKSKLDGHAWLVCGTHIVTGNSNISSFETAFIL